jgi:hypothetical protein
MNTILALVRAARRQLVVNEGYEVSIARDIFFCRLTARLLAHRRIIPECAERSALSCADALARELGEVPCFVMRGARHERVAAPLDVHLADAVESDPLVMGWAYQFWNETERDVATTGISRRAEAQTEHDEISVVTQLFTEEYMASFLIERCLGTESQASEPGDKGHDILDPACGVGHILVPFLRALTRGVSGSRSIDALRWLHGCDIDEVAVEICRLLLLSEAVVPGALDSSVAWSIVRENIQHLSSPWGTLDPHHSSKLLEKTYRCVITNPPYIGRRKLKEEARVFLDTYYPATSMDLCAAFMQRCLELTRDGGMIALVTIDKWLRLKQYEVLRTGGKGFVGLYRAVSLDVVCELGHRAFGAESGLHDGVGVCLLSASKVPPTSEHEFFFLSTAEVGSTRGKMNFLSEWRAENGTRIRQRELLRDGESTSYVLHHGMPARLSASGRTVRDIGRVVVGLQTSDDRRFVRFVWSVPPDRSRWIVHCKGGGYGRWFGLNRFVLDWGEGRGRFEADPKSGIAVTKCFDEEGWTYTWFANGALGLRRKEAGWSFGRAASSGFFCDDTRYVAFLNSRISSWLARRLGGKAQLPEGVVRSLPVPQSVDGIDSRLIDAAVFLKRALVVHDPTDASFVPGRVWDPREQLSLEALLLVVEGLLERQVCDTLKLSHAERRNLDNSMGTPVAWYRRRGVLNDDEMWSFIPESLRFLRSLMESPFEGVSPVTGGIGECARYLESPRKSLAGERPLPTTSLVESVSRGLSLHPFDVAQELMGMIGDHAAVDVNVVAPAFHSRIVALVLTELGHRWWSDVEWDGSVDYPELSVGELAARLERAMSKVVRISGPLRDRLIAGDLADWMVSKMPAAQLRVFCQTPLIDWRERRSATDSSLRHVWGNKAKPR